jgi:glucosamine kinase
VTTPAADADERVFVGIDAGGSRTRACAVRHHAVVHEGKGGPGNPLMADAETIRASYHAALRGCPKADRVAACVSGAGGEAQRAQIKVLLTDRFPDADVHVAPDYVAVLLAAPPGTDLCIVAGTGSVVCSRATDGSLQVSGGRGWILGDHGGAARLGRVALEHYVADVGGAPAPFVARVREFFGDDDWRCVVHAVHAAPNPAPVLARAAPLLTAAAEDGQQWAVRHLVLEMTVLAGTAARHIEQHVTGAGAVHVVLSGGVWSSQAAQSTLTKALGQLSHRPVTVTRVLADPLAGAIRLAQRSTW